MEAKRGDTIGPVVPNFISFDIQGGSTLTEQPYIFDLGSVTTTYHLFIAGIINSVEGKMRETELELVNKWNFVITQGSNVITLDNSKFPDVMGLATGEEAGMQIDDNSQRVLLLSTALTQVADTGETTYELFIEDKLLFKISCNIIS